MRRYSLFAVVALGAMFTSFLTAGQVGSTTALPDPNPFTTITCSGSASFYGGSNDATPCFTQDDDQQQFSFNLAGTPGDLFDVKMFTSSWFLGGFEPTLTLFDGAGNLYTSDNHGGSFPDCTITQGVLTDGLGNQRCLDGDASQLGFSALAAGSYTLVLTEFSNLANGPTLADGFSKDSAGNFTEGPCDSENGGFFASYNCSQLSNQWIATIQTAEFTPGTPEPQSVVLTVTGLALLFLGARRKRRSTV